jgi:hypothetical protein
VKPLIHAGSDARFLLLGGTTVGPNAHAIYILHCVHSAGGHSADALHFWRVRKDGGFGPL